MTALVVFAHGSSLEPANEAVRQVAARLAAETGQLVEAAFLEGGTPDLNGAVERCLGKGAAQITILPYFLTLGLHLQRDLPRLVSGVEAAHPGVALRVAQPLDGHPSLVAALRDRAAEEA